MAAVMDREFIVEGVVRVAPVVEERLAAFIADVGLGLRRPEQLVGRSCTRAGCWRRGLGCMGSWCPGSVRTALRGAAAFLADCLWDPVVVQRAGAERVAPEIGSRRG